MHDSEREKAAPFASVRPHEPVPGDAFDPFMPELVSIDDVVHRRIPEPSFALHPVGRTAPVVAAGWRAHTLGGRTSMLCHSFREADVLREMAVGRGAEWASAVGSVEVLDPSVFSPDMRARRADLVGRSLLDETVRRIPVLDADGIAAMADMRALLPPVGRPDLADGVDADSVLSVASSLRGILSQPFDGDVRRHFSEEVWRGDAGAMVDPGRVPSGPEALSEEDAVLAMAM